MHNLAKMKLYQTSFVNITVNCIDQCPLQSPDLCLTVHLFVIVEWEISISDVQLCDDDTVCKYALKSLECFDTLILKAKQGQIKQLTKILKIM